MSELGFILVAFCTLIFPNKAAEACWPTSIRSTPGSRHDLSPTPVKAIRASATLSWSRTNRTATPTMAKSPNLRANSVNDQPAPGGVSGIDASNTISSLESAVIRYDLKKSRAATSRLVVRFPTVTKPSRARSTAGSFAAGSAWARLAHKAAAIADLLITDVSQRLGKQWTAFPDYRISQQTGLTRQAADLKDALVAPCIVHPVNEVDINDMRGLSQAKIHERH